jgi:hypothetical protein
MKRKSQPRSWWSLFMLFTILGNVALIFLATAH